MKKGINYWSFRDHTLAEAFALAAKTGFEGVELALEEEGELGLSVKESDLARIKRQAADCGISLYSVATGLYWKYSLTDERPENRGKAESILKKQLEIASALGCDTILVLPVAVRAEFSPKLGVVDYETAYYRSLEALCRLKIEKTPENRKEITIMKPVGIGLVGCGFTGAAKAICYRVPKGAELAAAAQKLPLADMASDFRD